MIPRSRANTSTVTRREMSASWCSTRNSVLSSSLSTTGSRYCPSMVRWWSSRASVPSRASVIPASTKRAKASWKRPSRTASTRKGTMHSRRNVSKLGVARSSFIESFAAPTALADSSWAHWQRIHSIAGASEFPCGNSATARRRSGSRPDAGTGNRPPPASRSSACPAIMTEGRSALCRRVAQLVRALP